MESPLIGALFYTKEREERLMFSNIYYDEGGYIEMLKDILKYGVDVSDRTGVGTRAMFDAKLVYLDDSFPFSTIRTAGTRLAFEEFWFFLSGQTQTKVLEDKGIFFWQGNTTREFLDKRGLTYLEEGDMGKAYGYQMRKFSDTFDQVQDLFNTMKNDRYSRRMLMTLWNPAQSKDMALTPCWHTSQYVVLPDEDGVDTLYLKLINRSLDSLFGAQFALQQYRLFQMALAKCFNLKLGSMVCDFTQVHLYNNQIEYTEELLTREFGTKGKLEITKELETLDDILTMTWEDVKITGLEVNKTPFKSPRPPMAE